MSNLCRYGEFGIRFLTAENGQRLNEWIEADSKRSCKKRRLMPAYTAAAAGWIFHQPPSVKGTMNFIFGTSAR
jgi:hypothetical protein